MPFSHHYSGNTFLLKKQKSAKRVLVTGDRNWSQVTIIKNELKLCTDMEILIHGGAKGADSIAGEIAGWLGVEVLEFPALWDKYGKSAGPIRNRQMLNEGKPNFVLAFHNDIRRSKGTADMIKATNKAGLFVKLLNEKGEVYS